MSEPVPVIPLEYAKPEPARSPVWRAIVRVCHLLALLCCVVGWVLIWAVDVESVGATGPILFVLGLLLVIGGAVTRSWPAVGFGAAHVSVCVLFVALVNLLDWSPRQAEAPFTVIGGVYTGGAVAAALLWPSVFRKSWGARDSG